MKAAVLGASRGIGRALALQLADRGDDVFVLGRSESALASLAADLEPRGGGTSGHAICDLDDQGGHAAAMEAARKHLGGLDLVVLTAGAMLSQEQLAADPEGLRPLLDTNFTASVEFCEAARAALLDAGGGTLCVFGSVAGDRARKPNYVYGATKAGLVFYLDGLDLAWRDAGLRVVTVKPGFVHTDMTAGMLAPPFAGDAEGVARTVLRGLAAGKRVIYAPPVWRWVLTVLCLLPRPIFRKLKF